MTASSSSRSVHGYLALLRGNRSYRLLWTGEVVSLLGDWFAFVASATLVARLTGSGLAVGGLFVARMLPPFLISPVAGVAADRYDRKALLVISDLARACLVLGLLLVRDPSDVWLLYTLTACQLALSGVFFPARNAILPQLVTEHELGAANALSSVTWSVMLALGAALGGLFAGLFGVYVAFVVDSASYLVSALLLVGIPTASTPGRRPDRTLLSAGREYVDGLRYLADHRGILFTALHKALFGITMGGALQVVTVALARDVYVIGADGSTGLGLMYAVAGAGTGLGPLVARRFTGDDQHHLRRAIVLAYLMVAAGIAVMASLVSLPVVLFGVFMRGLGGGLNWVFSSQLLLMCLPDEVRGRVFSTEFAAFTLAQAIGTAVGGWALDNSGLSLQGMVIVLAVLPLIPGGLWAWWLRRQR